MFYYQHLLYSLLAGIAIATIVRAVDRQRRISMFSLLVFVVSVFGVQHLDVDHYIGSVTGLVNCGLKTNKIAYLSDPHCVDMHRGLCHQVRFGLFLGALVIGYFIHNWKRLLGIWLGSIATLYSVAQQVFVEASLFYLIGLVATGILVKTRHPWFGAMLAGLLVGWTHHMILDGLIHFWFGQVM